MFEKTRVRRLVPRTKAGLAAVTMALLAAVAGTAALTGGGEDSRPVTLEEAERLAAVRFHAYEAGPTRVEVSVPGGTGDTVVDGVVDYRAHRAVGGYATSGAGPAQHGMLAWDATGLAVAVGPAVKGAAAVRGSGALRAAERLSSRDWSPRAYSSDPLDVVLHVMMVLGQDRPDNAQLLAQGGARRLGQRTEGGVTYTLFTGPRPQRDKDGGTRGGRKGASPAPDRPATSPLTYWLDGQDRLGRLEVRLASLPRPARVDFKDSDTKWKLPQKPWQGLMPGAPRAPGAART
ncbi:hypothetical protein GCM10010278_79990 [Streptomyces melanogenes]|nr:hypothetical protein GCM10010278_79990 [Streptomyces melanogenes]